MYENFRDSDKSIFSKEKRSYPLFSFRFILQNHKKYTFGYFKKDIRLEVGAYQGLVQKIQEISNIEIKKLLMQEKENGIETFHMSSFQKVFQNAMNNDALRNRHTDGGKLTVIRFQNVYTKKEHRMICKQSQKDERIFHIIGFDFDYTAYNHG